LIRDARWKLSASINPSSTASRNTPRSAGDGFDHNPYNGQVIYTHGLTIDQPLSAVRLNYADSTDSLRNPIPYFVRPPTTLVPVWSALGRMDAYLVANHCPTFQGTARCWRVWTTPGFQAYNTEAQGTPATWQGQLLQDKLDQAGTKDRRARTYDPFFTGSFTQGDPIGISGGLTTYGFANGDPLTYSDPFGQTPYVQCRELTNFVLRMFGYTHCAIRVVEPGKFDVLIELIPDSHSQDQVYWRSADGEGASGTKDSHYDPAGWSEVARPEGESEEQFDRAVLNSAAVQTAAVEGTNYSFDGSTNSNHLDYETLKRARAKPPKKAVKGKGSPGLCGGSGRSTGTDCKP
jgi:RHS repeat-associated protein